MNTLRSEVENELRRSGFLPRSPGGRTRARGSSAPMCSITRASRLLNLDTVRRLLSVSSLDSRCDELHQDGFSFTLSARRLNPFSRRRSAKITVRAFAGDWTKRHEDGGSRYFVQRDRRFPLPS